MTPDDKHSLIKKAREEVTRRTGKSPEELYAERDRRLDDTVQMKLPDRVPVFLRGGFFPIKYAGLPLSASYYDPEACRQAVVKTLLDYAPDAYEERNAISGEALKRVGTLEYEWPGGSLRPEQAAQTHELETMKADEYDLFMTDPGDFVLRYYLPRAFTELKALSMLPSLHSLVRYSNLVHQSPKFVLDGVAEAFKALYEAGKAQSDFQSAYDENVHTPLGIPPLSYRGGMGSPPFDIFVSFLRGMHGVMTDMFRRPEKLLAALERVYEYNLARLEPLDPQKVNRRVGGGGNHFQSQEFLSRKQFERFVWPTWKKSLMNTIDLGFVPGIFMEGTNDDRIECFLELPKGRAFVRFEKIDIARAKAILGNHLCIGGGIPLSLLWGASPSEVEDYCKNVIQVAGKGGGFIMCAAGMEDDARPENIKAMFDSVHKYGRY